MLELALLRIATRALVPGGAIVVSVPNVAHWTVRLDLLCGRFQYRETGIMDATHLRWFTRDGIALLLDAAGLRRAAPPRVFACQWIVRGVRADKERAPPKKGPPQLTSSSDRAIRAGSEESEDRSDQGSSRHRFRSACRRPCC